MLKFACPSNVGITTLIDKSLFTLKVKVPAVRIVKALSKAAREALPVLALARRQSIVSSVEDSFSNLVLLCDDIPLTAAQHAFIASSKAEITSYELTLDYSYWTAQDILRSILPMELEVPSSFETVGHIAHMNLRDQYQSYKSIIAAVILDKSKNIRTVVNKLDSIQHTFRFFKMEVLAGDEDFFISNLVESKCRFSFDFSKVYWNSRLQSEHARLIEQFQPSHKICDVMAGIGPFALPSAKKGSLVFANDLNPDSFLFLSANIISNKLEHIVKPYNMDGRDFIATALRDLNDAECSNALSTRQKNAKKVIAATTAPSISNERQPVTLKLFDHYIMNLPATAVEFLDAFKGLYSTYNIPEGAPMPLVHCYCFSTAEDYKCDAMERCSQVLGYDLGNADIVSIHHVRNVAPKKAMLCISIRMPREILFECNEKIVKRAKHD